ncbi:MAG: heavy metal sensor histidine kinase, partial [Verrucomicrobiaceae bacterium]|nr:heavy metal sensor histidine kinase [Verrucomicrobiaceae bacterium]
MSSSRSSPRSIASRLVFFFTVAAALLLCCGFGILYFIVTGHAFAEDNEVLRDKVSALRGNLLTAGDASVLRGELNNPADGERVHYLVRVRRGDGEVDAETNRMTDLLPSEVFPSPKQNAPIHFRTHGRLFALVSTTVDAGGQSYILQVAQDRSRDEQFTKRLRLLLVALVASGTLASALIAINVTRRGLRPLAEMTHALERVGPKQLHERVPPEGWPRELRPLATAFGEMLGRLEFSFTRLSQFSADLAHELRTPIANMRGEAEVALTRSRTAEEYREVIESSVAECERLSAIIDNLLFLARAEASDNPVQPTLFDGAEAIQKIAAYYESVAEERNIRVSTDGSGQVYADPVLFGRALTNLLDNAIRFTPDGGAISISLRPQPAHTEIRVRDNGSGIAAEHLPRVFDRFYRADASRALAG